MSKPIPFAHKSGALGCNALIGLNTAFDDQIQAHHVVMDVRDLRKRTDPISR